jgi:hypothetical protein
MDCRMKWLVVLHPAFASEFIRFDEDVQNEMAALSRLLAEFGPNLKRPHADTLKGSRFGNLKELRFTAAGGVWRVAYAFDPKRNALLLCAGDQSGKGQARFYVGLIETADRRLADHLQRLRDESRP